MNRGDIWLCDLAEPMGHEQGGRRPVVILSSAGWLSGGRPGVVHVVPLTRTARPHLPFRIELEPTPDTGLRTVSYARCEDVLTVSPLRLIKQYGHVDAMPMHAIESAVRRILGL